MARSATLDMTQGSLSRQIIGFSLPLMFTNLLQMLFSMVDLAVVGRFSSSAAMARRLDHDAHLPVHGLSDGPW